MGTCWYPDVHLTLGRSVTLQTLFWALLLLRPARYGRWHEGQQRRSSFPVCSGPASGWYPTGSLILHVQNKTECTEYIHLIGEDILNLAKFFCKSGCSEK